MTDRGLTQRLRTVAFRNPLYAMSLGRGVPRQLALLPPDPWPGQVERGQELISGLYRFAGEKRETDRPPWKAPGAGDAFRFELHSFEWLRDLRAVGGDGARRHARTLVADWIETSTPCAIGLKNNGVAQLLSSAVLMPLARATATIAGTS